jgi:DNA-binding LytR/AlgR family response regulator
MLNAVIIEDERPALENLVEAINSLSDDVHIEARLSTVRDSIDYLQTEPPIDLIFSDVQLSDGLSFEIFQQSPVKTPVIFITGYDQFMMNAFEYNGIDYLLKPVDRENLRKAIFKYRMLEKHFTNDQSLRKLLQYVGNHHKKRVLVRKGLETISLRLDDVVLFYTENKIVYVIDRWGKKFMSDHNLSELEDSLDPSSYFRANRQYIINIAYIRGFKSYEKVKIQVELTMPELNHCIIISQETAPQFKEWMHNA